MKRRFPAMMLAAVMAGSAKAVPTTLQQPIPKPGYIFDMSRRKRKRFEARLERANRNHNGQRENRKARYHKNADERERHNLVKGMTNRDRTMWAKAGYPQDLDAIRGFRWPLHRLPRHPIRR